jgi:glycosyltransferase involved in cell wall biosynthesis
MGRRGYAMNRGSLYFREGLKTIAFIGNYLPRRCGIATFTADLLMSIKAEAPEIHCWAIVMNDIPEGYQYPEQVRFELNYKDLSDYRLASDFLNINQVDVVCLQHEFGIFGGHYGSYILELLGNLRMPVVTTLHTVLKEPNQEQKAIIGELARISDRLIVMSYKAVEILQEVYRVHKDKIVMIHHGIPDVPFIDPNYYKDQFGVEGRKVILTFGLISPGKGIEYMIDALPDIVKSYPDVTYIVLGATHPHVKKVEGESYRLSLQRRAIERGVENQIIFHNRFVELNELCEFIGAADIYVTPYINQEQIVSGTLAYAIGAGKAIISTPYWYAQEMLNEGRGRIVPFKDPDAISANVIELLDNEVERHAMRKRAYNFSRNMIWKEVAQRYLEVIFEVKNEREQRPKVKFHARTLEDSPQELPYPKFDHIKLLTDDVGILQHAKFIIPDRYHGYCTDDNARALIAVMMAQDFIQDDNNDLMTLAAKYLSFLDHALNNQTGRFRNLMGYDRRWKEEEGTEDCHGRALWGLGVAVALSKIDALTGVAMNIFDRALPAAINLRSPRALAFSLSGIHAYLRRFSGDSEVKRVRSILAERLFNLYKSNATDGWPWIEDIVTYANGKIPSALIVAGQSLQREDMIEAGLKSLKWLLDIQTDPNGQFVPIGNHGWFRRGGQRARFDQQPIEAQNMIDACIEAFKLTNEKVWLDAAQRCFFWFLGRNDLKTSLYDYRTGGCRDGLTSDGPNQNQGAESTLAWMISLLYMYSLRESATIGVPSLIHDVGYPDERECYG